MTQDSAGIVERRKCLTPGAEYETQFDWSHRSKALLIDLSIDVPQQYRDRLYRIYNAPQSETRNRLRDAIHDAIEPILSESLAYKDEHGKLIAAAHIEAQAVELERLRAENDRLSKAVCSGVLPGLLDDDEANALADFIKELRSAALKGAKP